MLDEKLKFHTFIRKKLSSANKALWGLRRIKNHAVSQDHLKAAYISYVRSTLEYSIPSVWKCLTGEDIDNLERVQKKATKIILGTGWTPLSAGYVDYDERLRRLGLERLSTRWIQTFNNFALKLEFDHRFSKYIKERWIRDVRNPSPYLICKASTVQRQKGPLRQACIFLNSLTSSVEQRRQRWLTSRRPPRSRRGSWSSGRQSNSFSSSGLETNSKNNNEDVHFRKAPGRQIQNSTRLNTASSEKMETTKPFEVLQFLRGTMNRALIITCTESKVTKPLINQAKIKKNQLSSTAPP